MSNQTNSLTVTMPYYVLMGMSIAFYSLEAMYGNFLTGIFFVLTNSFLTFLAICFVIAILATIFSPTYRDKILSSANKARTRKKNFMFLFNVTGTFILFFIADHNGWMFSSTLCATLLVLLAATHLMVKSCTNNT